jgi:hypothetical protein
MCDVKVIGEIKCKRVHEILPDAVFVLQHIAIEDRRFDAITKRDVYALAMTKEEFDVLVDEIVP